MDSTLYIQTMIPRYLASCWGDALETSVTDRTQGQICSPNLLQSEKEREVKNKLYWERRTSDTRRYGRLQVITHSSS